MSTSIYPSGYDAFIDPPEPSAPGIPGTVLAVDHIDSHVQLIDAVKALQTHVGSDGETDPASIEQRLTDARGIADSAADASAAAAADAISAMDAAALSSSALAAHGADAGAHDIASTLAVAIAAHASALDAHGMYALEADLGSAASLDAGTAVGDLVQVQTGGKLPALDGSDLINLPGGGGGGGDLTQAAADMLYAPIAKGVTNGDAHDHNGGGGAQIAYASLSGLPTLGTAAATNTTAYEPSGAVGTHNASSGAHGATATGAAVLTAASQSAARTALGLGSAATTASTAYATSTQGSNADAHAAASAPHAGHSTPATLTAAIAAHNSSSIAHPGSLTSANLALDITTRTATVSASRALTFADSSQVLIASAAVTLTIPNDATGGWSGVSVIEVYQATTGAVAFSPAPGVTLVGTSGMVAAQYATYKIRRVSVNTWAVVGVGGGVAPASPTPVSILGANLKLWIDFSDFATLYQDSAGTTPVTATGQQMGKALDQSGNGNHIIQPTSAKRGLVSAAYPGCVTLDGVDDNYYTASTLDLSAVSAVTVYLAFRQYNEIGSQCILEHSPDYNTNRAFNIFSPISTSPPNRTAIGYKGAASNTLVRYDSLADAPVKKVIVASVDLAQSLGLITACRMNGVVRTPAFAETILGGGNFLNAVLYIGSRAGTSLYSAADLCQIAIATGIQSSGVMAQMEAFLNSKIGAY